MHDLMPAIAAVSTAMAAGVGTTAWLAHAAPHGEHVTLWDYAGACTLIGIAAGTFSQPHHVAQLFGAAIAP
jgi:hypothetical protein